MIRVTTYILISLNIAVTTLGLFLLGLEIGSSWWSAGIFYLGWCLIPCLAIHYGASRFGSSTASRATMMASAVVTLLISSGIVWKYVIAGPIGPFSMLIFMPFPLTESLLVAPFLAYARSLHIRSQSD